MYKIKILLYLFLTLCIIKINVSCTVKKQEYRSSLLNVHPATQSYIDAFVLAGKINGKTVVIDDLIVMFSEDSFFYIRELARCTRCTDMNACTPIIRIRMSWWNHKSITDLNKREVMFHELGHCILGLYHNTHKDETGYPVSVMYPYHIGDNLYNESTISSFDTELFTGRNPTDFTLPVTIIKQGE